MPPVGGRRREALVGACLLLVLSVTNFAVRERRTWPSRCLPAYMHHVDTAAALQDDRAIGPPVRRRRLYRPMRLRRLPTSFFLCSLCLHLVLLSSNLFGDPAHASEMLGAPSAACWAQALAYQFFATGCVRPPACSRPAFRPSAAIAPLLLQPVAHGMLRGAYRPEADMRKPRNVCHRDVMQPGMQVWLWVLIATTLWLVVCRNRSFQACVQ